MRRAGAEVLKWAQRQAGTPLLPAAWEGETFDQPLPGRDPSAIRLRSSESDLWALRINRPDRDVPGRTWATEVVIGHVLGKPAQFSTRLIVATDEPELSIEPAVPGFIRQVATKCGLMVGGQSAAPVPTVYRTSDEADELIDHLLAPDRVLPTFILTSVQGATSSPVDPGPLHGFLLGLAHVAVAHSDACWMLTERLGKRLSVFGGAVRVYMPGFDEAADPFAHPLVMASALASQGGWERTQRWLREMAAQASLRRTRLDTDVLPFAAIRAANLELLQTKLRDEDASEVDQLAAAVEQIQALHGQIRGLKAEQEYYVGEYERERERAEVAENQSQKAAWRIQQLTNQIRTNGGDPDQDTVLPATWNEFADWCNEQLAGRLVLAPAAHRGVRKPLFDEVEIAARSLLWLATDGRDRFINGGGSLSNVRVLDGIENTPCGADAYEFDWNGRRYSADWHVKNGGNVRDPIRCLRIYYCFDPQTQQVVVSDMPAHRRTGAS